MRKLLTRFDLRRLAMAAAVVAAGIGGLAPAPEARAETRIKYFILSGTMEPLMIMTPGDPMAGGMFTEIIKRVFETGPYTVEPVVMPWQRMQKRLLSDGDWIMHGIPAFFEPSIPYELSSVPVFPFDHVAISLKDSSLKIERAEDLFGKRVILVENYHYPGLDRYLDRPVAGSGSGQIAAVRAFKPSGALRMLRHRRGDAVIGFRPRLLYHLKASGLSPADVVVADASAIIATEPMFVAYSPKHSAAFKRFLNARLTALRDSGVLAEIRRRYVELP